MHGGRGSRPERRAVGLASKECAGTGLARQSWRDSRDGAEGAAATIGEEATDMWAPAGDERERGGDGPLTSGPQRRTSLVG
jgi:hypothetical protein